MITNIHNFEEIYFPEVNEFSGMLKNIIDQIGTTNKYFVEFGFCDIEHPYDNTVFLKNNFGWDGLWLDVKPNTISYVKDGIEYKERTKQDSVKIHHITAENINDIFKLYNVPKEPDLMIIDINFNDFWVWKSMDYFPRLLMIEYNLFINPIESKVVKYDPYFNIDGTQYFGASFSAMLKLANIKGYKLIGCHYANMLFVKDNLYNDNFKYTEDVYSLYQPPDPIRHTHPLSRYEFENF